MELFEKFEQIEEKKYFLEWGSNSRIYLRAEMQKHFRSFLVQMKIAKSPFEINWPLETVNFMHENHCQF